MRKLFFLLFVVTLWIAHSPTLSYAQESQPTGLIVIYDSPSDTPEAVEAEAMRIQSLEHGSIFDRLQYQWEQLQQSNKTKKALDRAELYSTVAKRFKVKEVKPLFEEKQSIRTTSDEERLSTIYTVEVEDSASLKETLAAYQQLEGVRAAVYDEPIFPLLIPQDEYFVNQKSLYDSTGDHDIDATDAWDQTTGNPSYTVAVLDTGIDRTHPDLAANMWVNAAENPSNGIDDDGNGYVDDYYGWNFADKNNTVTDYEEHGTHVSGIIAARMNNDINAQGKARGIVGVSPNAKIMNLRILTDTIVDERTSDVLKAIQYVTDKAQSANVKVINMSFGATRQRTDENNSDVCVAYEPVLRNLYGKGVSAVAAAGNGTGQLAPETGLPFYTMAPAGCYGVISVGATKADGQRIGFSNYGETMTLSAPGSFIYSTCFNNGAGNNGYCEKSGTSMASPHVAGTVLLMAAKNPSLNPWQIRSILGNKDTNDDIPNALPGSQYPGGSGLLNANVAITAGINPPAMLEPEAMTVSDISMTFVPLSPPQYLQPQYTVTIKTKSTQTPVPYIAVGVSMKKPNGQTVNYSGYTDANGQVKSGTLIGQAEGYVGNYTVTVTRVAGASNRYEPTITARSCTYVSASSTPTCNSTGASVTPTIPTHTPTPTLSGPTPTRTPTPLPISPTPTPTTGAPQGTTKVGIWRQGTWYLRNTLTSGNADSVFAYGLSTDIPVMCDWDGNGSRTPGVFRNGSWYLRNSNSTGNADIALTFGQSGDKPICGDWNNDGIETIGVLRGSTWLLRNSNTSGAADSTFGYGVAGDIPVVGDWNNSGDDTVGVFRSSAWYLKNTNAAGNADISLGYGISSDIPVVGDWNNNGDHTVGIFRNGSWYLKNTNSSGNADLLFTFGATGDKPLVWR